jgi:Flagellar assembly protein FliH
MHDTFVSLHDFLRVPEPQCDPLVECTSDEEPIAEALLESESSPSEDILSDISRFRASLADALDARVEHLLCEIACSVLARELRLAEVDLRAVVMRELELGGEPPLRARAHPDDLASLNGCGCAVVADAALRHGDVVFELRCGTISATLGCRLEGALASVAAT